MLDTAVLYQQTCPQPRRRVCSNLDNLQGTEENNSTPDDKDVHLNYKTEQRAPAARLCGDAAPQYGLTRHADRQEGRDCSATVLDI